MELTETEKYFNDFYCAFGSTKVMSYPDMLVYKVYGLRASEEAKRANELIKEMKLPLTAKTNYSNGMFSDSIVIVPIENKY